MTAPDTGSPAAAAGFGGRPAGATDRPSLRLLEFRAVRKNTLRGFAALRLPNGLVIHDVVIGESHGHRWALLPAKPMIDSAGTVLRDEHGRIRYAPIVEWGSREMRDEFSVRVVALVAADHPEAFDRVVEARP